MPCALGNTGLLYGRGLSVACHHLAGDRSVSTPRFALPSRLYDAAVATPVGSGPSVAMNSMRYDFHSRA
jgi:hypothetical protein